jgi:hypothetical protein
MTVVLVLVVTLPRTLLVVSIDHLTRLAPEPTHVMPTRRHLEHVGWTSSHFFFCFLQASQARPDGTPGIARLHEASHDEGRVLVATLFAKRDAQLKPNPNQ